MASTMMPTCAGLSAPGRRRKAKRLLTKPAVVAPKSRSRLSVVARVNSDFTVPSNLVSLEASKTAGEVDASGAKSSGIAQYTLRFYTGSKMGAGLSAPDAGVQVMLIGEDGRGFMQRVDRYPDVAGMADLALYSHPRFERGGVDEVTFDAPDLGLPAAIWIAPEAGGEWYLEEVELSCGEGSVMAAAAASEGKPRTVSFPCMDKVGGRDPALELRPSVFGRMTPEQREMMRVDGLREYGELKVRMLAATGCAVLLGCAVTAAVGAHGHAGDFPAHDPLESMRAFAAGGGVGLVYLWMLTRSVDTMASGAETKPAGARAAAALTGFATSGPMRLLLLGWMGAAGSHHMAAAAAVDPISGVAHPAYGEALAAMLGFFSYKAGVLVAGFSGTDVGGPPSQSTTSSQSNNIVSIPVNSNIPVNDNYPRRVEVVEPWLTFLGEVFKD